MEHDFWHNCWETNEIGFHLSQAHESLARYWNKIQAKAGSTVLVPLCGKSHDLVWLANQGHTVIGVELSQKAVEAFFEEQKLTATIDQFGPYERYRCDNITILCGDFFALTHEHTGELGALYDRAATVALPEDMRRSYAKKLLELLPAGCRSLTITHEYDQTEMPGPPFSVPPQTLPNLFDQHITLEQLETIELLHLVPRMAERGLSSFKEHAMILTFYP